MAKWLIIVGVAIVGIGVILQYAPWLINWFGRLPGDIRVEGENSFVFIPITSMLLISILVMVLTNLFGR